MRLLKLVCSIVLALACLIGVGAIITSRLVHAAPLTGIVPVTTTIQAAIDAAKMATPSASPLAPIRKV